MDARRQREAFRADGRGNDRAAHRHRFVNLETRAAADAERHDRQRRPGDVRPDVLHAARHFDGRVLLREAPHGRGRVAADDGDRDARLQLPKAGEHLAAEVEGGILVRQPVHRAREDEAEGIRLHGSRRGEVLGVHARRDHVNRRAGGAAVEAHEGLAVRVRDGKDRVEASKRSLFEGEHAAPLRAQQRAPPRAARRLGVPPPDLGFNVVGEEHRRARDGPGHVHGRHEKIADESVVAPAREQGLDPRAVLVGPILGDRVGERTREVARRVGIEGRRALRDVAAFDCLEVVARFEHAVQITRRRGGIREAEVRDRVPRGEMP